jgi:hypothetical protein
MSEAESLESEPASPRSGLEDTERMREVSAWAARKAAKAAQSEMPCEDPAWDKLGGKKLETLLAYNEEIGGHPVRLVDARYLVNMHQKSSLLRRQDIPEEAFIDLGRLRHMGGGGFSGGQLRIVCISYPWLQPDHPDPYNDSMELVNRFLKVLLDHVSPEGYGHDYVGYEATYAVFLDFISLCQKGPNGEERTPTEAALFKAALDGLSTFYAHRNTIVLKVTTLPDGYPDGFTFSPDCQPNVAAYADRGWCFCESSLCNLIKHNVAVYDLGALAREDVDESEYDLHEMTELLEFVQHCVRGRAPPLDPDEFDEQLELKSFTSKSADLERVRGLYRAGFLECMEQVKELHYHDLSWGDAELATLTRALCVPFAFPNLEMVRLGGNNSFSDLMQREFEFHMGNGAIMAKIVYWPDGTYEL